MKTLTSFLAASFVIAACFSFAQTNKPLKFDHHLTFKKSTVKLDPAILKLENSERLSLSSPNGSIGSAGFLQTRTSGQTLGSIVIGTTYYDFQTGLSVARRVLRRD